MPKTLPHLQNIIFTFQIFRQDRSVSVPEIMQTAMRKFGVPLCFVGNISNRIIRQFLWAAKDEPS